MTDQYATILAVVVRALLTNPKSNYVYEGAKGQLKLNGRTVNGMFGELGKHVTADEDLSELAHKITTTIMKEGSNVQL